MSFKRVPYLLCFTLLVSCASDDVATRPQKQVECKYWLQQCHIKARKTCASGYTVSRSVRLDKVGGPQGSYKSYKMFFSCN